LPTRSQHSRMVEKKFWWHIFAPF